MEKRYGLPYKGSKNKIVKDIVDFLPEGDRLVDLFGGGGSISEYASLSGKYNSVLYNEIKPLVVKGFQMAINKEFQNERRWISREDFFNLKDTDPYVAICFSYNTDMKSYAFSREVEPWKQALHYAKLFNDFSYFEKFDVKTDATCADIRIHLREYREKYCNWVRKNYKSLGIEKLSEKKLSSIVNAKLPESTQFTDSVLRLQRLQSISFDAPIEVTNKSYEEYEYKSGDIVYCDPPYEDTNCGSYSGFNSKEFYDWVASRDYQVFFSSYWIEDERFFPVWKKEKRVLTVNEEVFNTEYIYSNMEYKKKKNSFIFGV